MDKQSQLDALKAKIESDMTCPLKDAATNIVFGKGDPNADILFIGEAPGRNEDLQGLPFVGAAGKNLDKLLHAIGLDPLTEGYANIYPVSSSNLTELTALSKLSETELDKLKVTTTASAKLVNWSDDPPIAYRFVTESKNEDESLLSFGPVSLIRLVSATFSNSHTGLFNIEKPIPNISRN